MNKSKATLLGWAAIALCAAIAILMNQARIQHLNFNLYVFLCIAGATALVLIMRWLGRKAQNQDTNSSP